MWVLPTNLKHAAFQCGAHSVSIAYILKLKCSLNNTTLRLYTASKHIVVALLVSHHGLDAVHLRSEG